MIERKDVREPSAVLDPEAQTRRELSRTPLSNEAEAPGGETARPAAARQSWRPLRALLELRAFEALRERNFRLLWLGQACTGMGTWMDQVTRGWLIYELTNSALQLGLVRGIQAIPFLLLSPVAGSVADRYSRKMQVLVAQVADGLFYAMLALLITTGRIQPWHVYVTAFLMAIAQVFQQPARSSPCPAPAVRMPSRLLSTSWQPFGP